MQSDDEMQLLRQLYMTMLRFLRHQYLDNLLEMQALCTLLCSMHSSTQVSRLELSPAFMLAEAAFGTSLAHHCQCHAQHKHCHGIMVCHRPHTCPSYWLDACTPAAVVADSCCGDVVC